MGRKQNPYGGDEDLLPTRNPHTQTMEQEPVNQVQPPVRRPRSSLHDNESTTYVDEDTLKKIRGGFIAALISGALTLVFTMIATSSKGDVTGFLDKWAYIDVVFIFALAIGIFFKSRVAATTMFVYFVASKFYIWHATGHYNGIFIAMFFIYWYFQAMMGTFEYHKQVKASR